MMYSKKVHRLNLSLAQLLHKCVLLLSLCKSQATKTTSNPYFFRLCTQQKTFHKHCDVVIEERNSQIAKPSLWPILKETGEGRSKSTKPTHYCTIGSLSSMWVLKAHGSGTRCGALRRKAAAAVGIAKMQVNVRQRLHDLLRTWATPRKRLGFRVCQNGEKKVKLC